MKVFGLIYKIVNLSNNKIYIGKTTQKLNQRFNQHLNSNKDSRISRAIKKHGKENFIIIKICSCKNEEQLNKAEIYFINHYNSIDKNIGYNCSKGGDGFKMTDEQKLLFSKSQSGIGNNFYGKKHKQETKEKIRLWNLSDEAIEIRKNKNKRENYKHSINTKIKMSESWTEERKIISRNRMINNNPMYKKKIV